MKKYNRPQLAELPANFYENQHGQVFYVDYAGERLIVDGQKSFVATTAECVEFYNAHWEFIHAQETS